MPSGQTKVLLLDSNAYFRLALSLHPLLIKTFGQNPKYRLCVIQETQQEWMRNPRLKNKFHWVSEKQYEEDRGSSLLTITRKDEKQIETANSYIAAFENDMGTISISRVDMRVLAVGYVRGIVVISDDKGMQVMGKNIGVQVWGSLELLKLMLINDRITNEPLDEVVRYWEYENDLPIGNKKTFCAAFENLFQRACPI